jgi:hypothetical protein
MLAAIWLTACLRKLVTKSVPGLVTISLIVLTVQTLAAIVTGSLWIFLLHFPLANLGLCLLFARTAGGRSPIAARLAAEVIGLRCPPCHQRGMHRFFQGVTVLWASVFLVLAIGLGTLLATIPVGIYVPVWAVSTIVVIAAGIGVSVWWLRSVTRRLGISFRFVVPAVAGSTLADISRLRPSPCLPVPVQDQGMACRAALGNADRPRVTGRESRDPGELGAGYPGG